jgi:hypothetical protein
LAVTSDFADYSVYAACGRLRALVRALSEPMVQTTAIAGRQCQFQPSFADDRRSTAAPVRRR